MVSGGQAGHAVVRLPGGAVVYWLHDRGNEVHSAAVHANGWCVYDDEDCLGDDADHLALTTAALPVAVRRTALPALPIAHGKARVPREAFFA